MNNNKKAPFNRQTSEGYIKKQCEINENLDFVKILIVSLTDILTEFDPSIRSKLIKHLIKYLEGLK